MKWTGPILALLASLIVTALASSAPSDRVSIASPGVPGRIAFSASDGGIWTVGADGSGWRRLANGDELSSVAPAWSRDGERLAYVSLNDRVYAVKHDGSSRMLVARGFFGSISWSPDGSALVLSENDRATRGRTTVSIVNVGTKPRRIVRWSTPPQRHSPAWSPDGGLIAYTLENQIYLTRPDHTGVRRLAPGWQAEWTADGRSVAVYDRGAIRLYPRGGGAGKVLVRVGDVSDFSLDPSGKRVVVGGYVLSGNSVAERVFIIDIATGTRRDVTGDNFEGAEPDWQSRCTIYGTEHADTIRGTQGPDVICGLGGSDRILGRGGDDVIYGGYGADELDGGAGNDWLFGSFGDDAFHAHRGGRDIVDGGPGDDRAEADDGLDTTRSVDLHKK